MSIIVIDLTRPADEKQQAIELISKMPFPEPHDFVFDYINRRLALAVNFEGHPELVFYLNTLPAEQEVQAAGGRFGRTVSGSLATSEWSGHYGHAWNESTRNCWIKFMEECRLPIIHREWHVDQTAYEVG